MLSLPQYNPAPFQLNSLVFQSYCYFILFEFLYLAIRLLYLAISWQTFYIVKKSFLFFIEHFFYKKNFILFLLISCFSSILHILILNFSDVNITFGINFSVSFDNVSMCTMVNAVMLNGNRWKPSLSVHNSVNPVNLKPNC